ncbi:MAG: hypothetical protein KC503_19005 [Myxococcales bacterium]|nr:hypothetical protein [Myxococcales bacterium]
MSTWIARAAIALLGGALIAGCTANARTTHNSNGGASAAAKTKTVKFRAGAYASKAFFKHWGDGKAELSGYKLVAPRYGATHPGYAVLIYVTEPMDSATWIKDDGFGGRTVPRERRVDVIKLNHLQRFRTGIYTYALMASTFAPVHGLVARERFAPTKIALSVQDWCGHVYYKVVPEADRFTTEIRSYFGSEGERTRRVATSKGTLYEDALLIQLRELDGKFNDGKPWSGKLVPTAWKSRKAHQPIEIVSAEIKRSDTKRGDTDVTRFVLTYGSFTRTFDVEKAAPHRVLYWEDSQGTKATLLKTARLPYWALHEPSHGDMIKKLGLEPKAL